MAIRSTHVYLAAILLLHMGVAILGEAWFWNYAPDGGPEGDWMRSPAIYWVPLLLLIFLWLKADAKQRQAALPAWLSFMAPLLFPVAVPYYYFRTTALRGAFVRTGMFVLFVAMCIGAARLANIATFEYYAVWTNPVVPKLGPKVCNDYLKGHPLVSSKSKPIDPEKFEGMEDDRTLCDVVIYLGPAVRDVGSGLIVLEWQSKDGRVFRVGGSGLNLVPIYARFETNQSLR